MRNKLRFGSGAFLVLAIATTAFGQAEDPQLRKDIIGMYRLFEQKYNAADFKGAVGLLHKGFTMVDRNGNRSDYAQTKGAILGIPSIMRNAKCVNRVVHVRGNGNEAYAWVETVFTWTPGTSGKATSLKKTLRYADTLRMTSEGWKWFYRQELPTDEPWPFGGGN